MRLLPSKSISDGLSENHCYLGFAIRSKKSLEKATIQSRLKLITRANLEINEKVREAATG
jgi:hypothetical protein